MPAEPSEDFVDSRETVAPQSPDAAMRVDDARAERIRIRIKAMSINAEDLLADRADMLGELARLKRELTELAYEPAKNWDREGSYEYHDGYETGRDIMGQQVIKIIEEGATAKEVQEWAKR